MWCKRAVLDLVRDLLLQRISLHLCIGSRLSADDGIECSILEDVMVMRMKIRKRGRTKVKEMKLVTSRSRLVGNPVIGDR